MGCRHKQLAPGVDLLTEQTDRFKTGLLAVTLTVPLCEETAGANALIAEVLYRGSRLHPDIESLCAATDQLYGASLGPVVRQRGECQCIGFMCGFIDDRYALDGMAVFEPAAELVGEVLLDPALENGAFCRSAVEGERANLADRIRTRIHDKRGWAIFRMIEEMCAGEAYAVDKLGGADRVESLTPEELWTHYQRLISDAQVVFHYIGSADPLRVESALRHAFSALLTARKKCYSCHVFSRPKGDVRRVTERMDVSQSRLVLGFRTGGIILSAERYPALLVFNALYGGTAHSRLFMNVREKQSLCYDISSEMDELKGILAVSCGVDHEDLERAEGEILCQLECIRRGAFSPEEMNAAVRAVVSAIVSRRDSQGRTEDAAVTRFLLDGGREDADRLVRAVEAVTAEDVMEAASLVCLDTVYALVGKEEQ